MSHRNPAVVATFAVALIALAASVHAAAPNALERAVTDLGRLNGVALACQQNALAARMRTLMIELVPKKRVLGEYFEHATHGAFLEIGHSGAECPDGRSLAEQVDAARASLLLAVPEQP